MGRRDSGLGMRKDDVGAMGKKKLGRAMLHPSMRRLQDMKKIDESESEANADDASTMSESDEEVFDLKASSDSDESNESGEDNEGSTTSDSDVDSDEEDENELGSLVRSLPADLKQRILSKDSAALGDDDGSDDDEDVDENAAVESWGKKKPVYWAGDTADLEIGQDMEDAEDEESAAKELHKSQVSRTTASDYFETQEDSAHKKLDRKGKKEKKLATGSLQALSLDQASCDVESQLLQRDVRDISQKQRRELAMKESPELVGLIRDLNEKTSDLQERIVPALDLIQKMESVADEDDDLVQYLSVKRQLLSTYCMNITFYLLLKVEGQSTRDHPVMKQLLELRYAMEKMRPLDSRLQHQVARLLARADEASAEKTATASSLKPNLRAMMDEDDEDEVEHGMRNTKTTTKKTKRSSRHDSEEEEDESEEDDDEDEDEEEDEEEEEDGDLDEDSDVRRVRHTAGDVYRAPKLSATPYRDGDRESDAAEKKLRKSKNRLKNSEILDSLQEEFSNAPEASSSTGMAFKSSQERRLEEDLEERQKFEEDRFVRLTMTRKEKKAIKRQQKDLMRMEDFADVGDIGDLEDVTALSKLPNYSDDRAKKGKGSRRDRDEEDDEDDVEDDRAATGTERSLRTSAEWLASASEDFLQQSAARKRRRAPDASADVGGMEGPGDLGRSDDDDDEEEDDAEADNLLDAFASKKRAFAQGKKEHYTGNVRFGGVEESVADGEKRAVSYEIMKNKGLTPHRKKANRNPRVKKREAFHKATVARKGQVREANTSGAAYGGELTGIKANLSRSRRIQT